MTKKYVLKRSDSSSGLQIQFRDHLNPSQFEVVTQADGPSLVLAGAGSGKTRTLIYRVLHLLDQGVNPENILLVTFTNKAAHEMRSRVEQYLGKELKGLWCGTFHHVGHRLLRQYAQQAGLQDSFGILDQEDSRALIKSSYAALSFKPSEMHFPKAGVLQSIFSFAANVQKTVPEIIEERYGYFSHFTEEIVRVHETYERRKLETNNLDFDGLLLRWIHLMTDVPEVRNRIMSQFRYCLVDEYQDINPLQNKVIEILASDHQNLLVVGDDAQSIYSFRGAQVQSILEFPKRHEKTQIFKLETNYRSTPQILDLANNSIANNLEQFQKELKSVRSEGLLPQLLRVRDSRDQAAFVSQRILEYLEEGLELSEIAVLFRARYQAADLELELSRRKLPYVLRGGVRFFEQAHIKDVLSYLKILENPKDEIAWNRAVTLYPGIGMGTARKLHEGYLKHIETEDPVRVLDSEFVKMASKRAQEGAKHFAKLLASLYRFREKGSPDLLVQSILDSGYGKILESRFENAKDRFEDLRELANFAHTYSSVTEFLNDVALRENFRGESFTAGEDADEEHLVLSTIHQAKGLEWKVVFILSLGEGQFPHHQARGDDMATEEERRLFYVAVTRAKDELYLIHPMTRFDREAGTVICRPSPFIEELPSHVYEGVEVVEESQDAWDMLEDSISVDE